MILMETHGIYYLVLLLFIFFYLPFSASRWVGWAVTMEKVQCRVSSITVRRLSICKIHNKT